jgi:hypothetical protein
MIFWPWATRIVMLGNPEVPTAAAIVKWKFINTKCTCTKKVHDMHVCVNMCMVKTGS